MARVADHPNLVLKFDLGENHDQPHMTQPLMVSGDVDSK